MCAAEEDEETSLDKQQTNILSAVVIDSFKMESSDHDEQDDLGVLHQDQQQHSSSSLLISSSNLKEFAKRSLNLPIYSLVVFSVIGLFLICGCFILVCFLCMFIIGGIIELRRIRVVGIRRHGGFSHQHESETLYQASSDSSYYEDQWSSRQPRRLSATNLPSYSEAVGSTTAIITSHQHQGSTNSLNRSKEEDLPSYKDIVITTE